MVGMLFFCVEGDYKTMKKPMTTKELFEKIQGILKEKGRLPDILDYGLATHRPVPITNYEFDLKSNLNYGSNEGIYLDLWIEYYEGKQKQQKGLGTFKTLSIDNEAMHIMAALLADFIIEEYSYVNANLDDFTWGARSPVDFGPAPTGVERRRCRRSSHRWIGEKKWMGIFLQNYGGGFKEEG